MDVEQIKTSLNQLNSPEQLDILVSNLTYKILEMQNNYNINKKSLLNERKELFNKIELSNSQLAFALAELDQRIADHDNTYEQQMLSLKGQRTVR